MVWTRLQILRVTILQVLLKMTGRARPQPPQTQLIRSHIETHIYNQAAAAACFQINKCTLMGHAGTVHNVCDMYVGNEYASVS